MDDLEDRVNKLQYQSDTILYLSALNLFMNALAVLIVFLL